MTNEEFEAFKQAWLDYPSQDNEGYVPDRGGFKSGWFAALNWIKERDKLSQTYYIASVAENLGFEEDVIVYEEKYMDNFPGRNFIFVREIK